MKKEDDKPDEDLKEDAGTEKDFHLGEPYEELCEAKVYESDRRIGKIFGVKDIESNENLVRMLSKSYKYNRREKVMKWKSNYGFNLYNYLQINSLINGLRNIAKRLGWNISEVTEINQLKETIRQQAIQLNQEKASREESEQKHQETLKALATKIEELGKSRLPSFKTDIIELEEKIKNTTTRKIPESELQEFLYTHSWLFGLEYLTSQPQVLRGVHNKFDFYLERFNKTNDIVEIKLISDKIINDDGSITAKVIQAVDQLIEYIESSIAAAHSTVISEEEGIKELRPRGVVVIGSNITDGTSQKLHKWNYQFAHIKIMTYQDLLEQGKAIIYNVEGTNN